MRSPLIGLLRVESVLCVALAEKRKPRKLCLHGIVGRTGSRDTQTVITAISSAIAIVDDWPGQLPDLKLHSLGCQVSTWGSCLEFRLERRFLTLLVSWKKRTSPCSPRVLISTPPKRLKRNR